MATRIFKERLLDLNIIFKRLILQDPSIYELKSQLAGLKDELELLERFAIFSDSEARNNFQTLYSRVRYAYDEAKYNMIHQMSNRRNEQRKTECTICCNYFSPNNFVKFECDHSLCRQCFVRLDGAKCPFCNREIG